MNKDVPQTSIRPLGLVVQRQIVKYCILMVHALSNSGYSVNVEIVTIHMFFVKFSFKILHTNIQVTLQATV